MRGARPDTGDGMQLDGVVIIYDLDGTLVDSAPDLVRALNEVVTADGLPGVPVEDVRRMVGRGARALLQRAYARAGTALPTPILHERVGLFLEAYSAGIATFTAPFPGVIDTLAAFRDAGARQVVATNKPDGLTEQLLDTLGISDWFDAVVGATSAPRRKPDPSHLVMAAGGADWLRRAVMVGDSAPDVGAARAAGVPSIVLSYGYSETPAHDLGADRVIDQFEALPETIAELLAERAADSAP